MHIEFRSCEGVTINGSVYTVPAEVANEIRKLRSDKEQLKAELSCIKPVYEVPGFKPAMTMRCEACQFSYFSDYNGRLLGCCKDAVCSDFVSAHRMEE